MLTGIKLKMSTAYHPKTDGSSERSNKTIVQTLWYHVERNQRGWAKSLPHVCFTIMNTVNLSTSFSPFQLCMGCSPHLILPLTLSMINDTSTLRPEADTVVALIKRLSLDVMEAQDNLLATKVAQSEFVNRHRGEEHSFAIGDKVMLSTEHWHWEYMQAHSNHSAKFMPQFDGPYCVVRSYPTKSNYMLDLPNELNRFPTFHSSLLHPYHDNDSGLFPSCTLPMLGPVVTIDGEEEWTIEWILDERRRGRGYQYLVRWQGWGPEEDRWLSGRKLADTAALDAWLSVPEH
jgi:hypothetical protein